MAYKKIELEEPIYELQENETERQHYFLDLYFTVDDNNLTKYIESFKGLKKGQKWVYSGSENILEFNPPKKSTFEKWVSCLQYRERRKAFWKDTFNFRKENRKEKATKFLDKFGDGLMESIEDNIEIGKKIKNDFMLDPHLKARGKKDIANATKEDFDMLKEVTGVETTEPSTNLNVNLEARAEILRKLERPLPELKDDDM